MTNAIEDQIKRAQAAVRGGFITREELGREAGIRPTTIRHMLDDDWNPTRKTLTAIVAVLDRLGVPSPLDRRRVAAVA